MAKFKNPSNGFVEDGGGAAAFFWALCFGPLYFALKGVWAHALIYVVVVIALWTVLPLIPFAWVIYAALAPGIVDRQYMRRGWVKVEKSSLRKG